MLAWINLKTFFLAVADTPDFPAVQQNTIVSEPIEKRALPPDRNIRNSVGHMDRV